MQSAVQAVFMEPHWLNNRLMHFIALARTHISNLQLALPAAVQLEICQYAGLATFALASVPLLRLGIRPSSSRILVQLRQVSPTLYAQICALQGGSQLAAHDVLALHSLFMEFMSLGEGSQWGGLTGYFARKVIWMAEHGLHQESVHAMWICVSVVAEFCSQHEDRAQQAMPLADRWLQGVHWTGEQTLTAKIQMASQLLQDIEALAAPHPSAPPA
jgi:hypothetical protein